MAEMEESRVVSENSDSAQGKFARVSMGTMVDTAPNKEMTQEEAEAKARLNETNEPNAEETLFANKYKSVEELEKAYNELQSKLGQESSERTESEETAEETTTTGDDVFDTAYNQWSESGEVSDEVIDQIVAEKGIPREYVEQFIQQATAQEMLTHKQIFDSVGGEEQYKSIISWAENNLPASEIETYNKIIDSGDVDQIKFAINALSQRRGGKKFVSPDTNRTSEDATSFGSKAEMVEAMKDPRYERDRAYRQKVERMIMRSKI